MAGIRKLSKRTGGMVEGWMSSELGSRRMDERATALNGSLGEAVQDQQQNCRLEVVAGRTVLI